jgi:uncharacterized membrane protein (DUF4010 family)
MADPGALISSPYMQILLVLGLSFLMGLEREEHKARPGSYVSAGVRTIPLIGLLGYMLVVLSPDNLLLAAAGLLAVAVFLVVSYQHKIAQGSGGFTSEMAALVAYAVGALIAHNEPWIAVAVAVADVLLLSAKQSLEGLAQRLDQGELTTFVKFLLLAGVVLPVLPNQAFTQFGINPFRTWLIVVVVSGMSYGSYLLQRCVKARQSAVLSALLGGAYSSTLATVTLAKGSVGQGRPRLYSGAIVLATAVMYLRLGILIYIFNPALATQLEATFGILIVVTALAGLALMAVRSRADAAPVSGVEIDRNPLELVTAFVFAALFILLSVATRLVSQHLGSAGVYGLAGIMGVTDIDPFVLSLAQAGLGPAAAVATPITTAALAVIIAAASNNIVKGIYAISFGGRQVGLPALVVLTAIGIAGILIYAL